MQCERAIVIPLTTHISILAPLGNLASDLHFVKMCTRSLKREVTSRKVSCKQGDALLKALMCHSLKLTLLEKKFNFSDGMLSKVNLTAKSL